MSDLSQEQSLNKSQTITLEKFRNIFVTLMYTFAYSFNIHH